MRREFDLPEEDFFYSDEIAAVCTCMTGRDCSGMQAGTEECVKCCYFATDLPEGTLFYQAFCDCPPVTECPSEDCKACCHLVE